MAILDIRGTHGSGKSWIPHQLLSDYDHELIKEGKQQLGIYIPELDLAIVGKYSNVCGGCDGVKSADEVVRRVRLFSQEYTLVMLEGILVSHTFQRYSNLANELGDYRFLFLNTPLNVCIKRVEKRRKAKGNKKPLDPKNIIHDHRQIWERTRAKCLEAGHNVIEVDWLNPMNTVMQEIENA